MSDGAVPHPWRVCYALAALAGMRSGEVAGLRWGDYAALAGSLFVHCQYQDRPLKTAKDEDTKEHTVPIDVELARIFAEWRLEGGRRALHAQQRGRHSTIRTPARTCGTVRTKLRTTGIAKWKNRVNANG